MSLVTRLCGQPTAQGAKGRSVGELAQALLVLAAMIGIYAFMFRGIFGKSRGKSLFAGKSLRLSDGPAWGTAMMGGFAAGQLADAFTWSASATISIAVVAGLSAALGKNVSLLGWPAALIALGATLASVTTFGGDQSGVGAWGVLFYVVLAIALGDTVRWAFRWRRGNSVADKAMAYFAATEAAMFIAAPGGVPVLEGLQRQVPVGKVTLVLVLTLMPFVIGLFAAPFLAMFSTGIALAGLYLDFLGLGQLGFLASMGLIAAAMVAYWFARWIVRGFGGSGLLAD